MSGLTITPVRGLPELREGDDLAGMIAERAQLEDGDVAVVAQKAISKIEGRVVRLDDVEPSARAQELAGDDDPRRVEVILGEAKRVVRNRGSLLITETRHGFICASSGVDASNAPEPGTVVLLPVDPDASASRLRSALVELTGCDLGVVVSDSFGRPWRQGTTDIAVGAAGVEVLRDLKGERDPSGYELKSTVIAVADEIAGAAELVMGKLDRTPVAIVRGLDAARRRRGERDRHAQRQKPLPVTAVEIDTPHGPGRVHLHEVKDPRGAVVLMHGAGGGVEAPDLVAAREAAISERFTVALVEQPYRVAGRRAPPRAPQLDAAWTAIVESLLSAQLASLPLIVGGRSMGGRVACRTAEALGAAAVLCLAFPLEPPGRKQPQNRLPELDAVPVPTLVVQGETDPFGMPPPGPRRRVVEVPGNHALKADPDAVFEAVRAWLAELAGQG